MLTHLFTDDRRAVWCGADSDAVSSWAATPKLSGASCTACLDAHRRDFLERAQENRERSAAEAERAADDAEARAAEAQSAADEAQSAADDARKSARDARERAHKLRAAAARR